MQGTLEHERKPVDQVENQNAINWNPDQWEIPFRAGLVRQDFPGNQPRLRIQQLHQTQRDAPAAAAAEGLASQELSQRCRDRASWLVESKDKVRIRLLSNLDFDLSKSIKTFWIENGLKSSKKSKSKNAENRLKQSSFSFFQKVILYIWIDCENTFKNQFLKRENYSNLKWISKKNISSKDSEESKEDSLQHNSTSLEEKFQVSIEMEMKNSQEPKSGEKGDQLNRSESPFKTPSKDANKFPANNDEIPENCFTGIDNSEALGILTRTRKNFQSFRKNYHSNPWWRVHCFHLVLSSM